MSTTLLRRSAAVLLVVVATAAHSPVAFADVAAHAATSAPKWLWGHLETSMGLGDQLRFHHALLLLARGSGRGAVLPALQLSMTDWTSISSVDPLARKGTLLDEAIERAMAGRVRHSANFPRTMRIVRIDEWFDLDAIAAGAGVPAVPFEEWNATTGGIVDRTLVPSRAHGCLPSWEDECASGRPRDRDLAVAGRSVSVREIACVDYGADAVSEAAASALLASIAAPEAAAAATLGLSGWCLRMTLPPSLAKRRAAVERGFRLSSAVRGRATQWLSAHGLGRFAAVHWRRGDVLVDHYAEFAYQTPERVAASLAKALRSNDVGELDGVVLLTDAFSRPELARFGPAVERATGLRVLRYDADAALARPFDPERELERTILDLAIGGAADVLAGTYAGSNFFQLMAVQRGDRPPLVLRIERDGPP